jgi:hypothetical protein
MWIMRSTDLTRSIEIVGARSDDSGGGKSGRLGDGRGRNGGGGESFIINNDCPMRDMKGGVLPDPLL